MNEEDGLGIPLAVVAFIVALVIALVIGLAIRSLPHGAAVEVIELAPTPVGEARTDADAPMAPADTPFADIAPVGEAQLKVYFAVGQTDLSDADRANVAALAKVVNTMGENEAVVLVSGYHDESGGAQINAEVARQRALSVREALVAAGVPEAMIRLRKPEATLGSGDAAEARRVEVRVQ